MGTQQGDFCCLSDEENQSSTDVPHTETGKTIQITKDSQCPPVDMVVRDIKINETNKNIPFGKKNAESNEVKKTLSDDIMNLTSENDDLQETIPAATSVKIEMSEETQTSYVNTELRKKTYDVVETQEDVTDCLTVGMNDEETRSDDLCADRGKTLQDQITKDPELCKKTYDMVETEEDVTDCLIVDMKAEETRSDDLCTNRGKTPQDQITKESQCIPPVETFKTERNKTDETIIHDEKKTKTREGLEMSFLDKVLDLV